MVDQISKENVPPKKLLKRNLIHDFFTVTGETKLILLLETSNFQESKTRPRPHQVQDQTNFKLGHNLKSNHICIGACFRILVKFSLLRL